MKRLFVTPTLTELSPFLDKFRKRGGWREEGKEIFTVEGGDWICATVGIGLVFPAIRLTQLIARYPLREIYLGGIAGSLQDEVKPGDVVVGSEELFLDLGTLVEEDRFLSLSDLGLDHHSTLKGLGNRVPLPLTRDWKMGDFPFRCHRGNLGSANSITGTEEHREFLRRRHPDLLAENMEGAAVALCAHYFGIPCGEIRAISNRAGKRNREEWRVGEGLGNLVRWLSSELFFFGED